MQESRPIRQYGKWNNDLKKKIVLTVLAATLLLLLYMIIFGFSAQDAEESGSLSQMVSQKCVDLLNDLSGKGWTMDYRKYLMEWVEHPLRKLAHFSEYACMGVLLYVLWSQWLSRGKRLYLLICGWLFVSAALDEFHQFFVPGRYCSLKDVLLDTCGGITGMLVCAGIAMLCKKRRERTT